MILMLLHTQAFANWSTYDQLLNKYVSNGKVDYTGLRSTQALGQELLWIASAELPKDKDAQKAFWINSYNLITLDLIVDNPTISSIKDLDDGEVWSQRTFKIAGRYVTLDEIEHKILRPMEDPRIHSAINCASISCPPLHNKAYTSRELSRQLDEASRRWVKSNALLWSSNLLQLNPIFSWFSEDFSAYAVYGPKISKSNRGAVGFIIHFAEPELQEELFILLKSRPTINHFKYNWGLNKQ
jgi:hypothetical protein